MNGDTINPAGTTDDEGTLDEFVRQSGVTFPIALGADHHLRVYEAGARITPYPLEVLADADGNIVYLTREYDVDALIGAIDALLP
jgi:hypothetical protein